MCIRDRHVGDARAQRDQEEIVRVVAERLVLPTEDLLELRPVSYTHLRAHETVLDLVCRLLLEKKKTIFLHTISIG